MWQYWLIASGAFFIGEIITVGFLLFWFGVASLITMVVSFFTTNIIIQCIVFLISSVILILATKPFAKKFLNNENIVTNVNSLIGKKAIVIQDIDNLKSTGQVKIGGEIWSAQSESNDIISKDTEVEIVKIDAGDVARRYIGRKLNAAEAAARGACEGTQQHGLACTGDVLKQHMAAAEIAGGDQRQLLPLSENRLRAGVYEPVVPRNEAIGIHSLPSDFFFSIIARQKGNVNELFCETE